MSKLEITVVRLHPGGCPLETLYEIINEKEVTGSIIEEIEDALKELEKHEKYIRNLRQQIEHKIRTHNLREASSSLRE